MKPAVTKKTLASPKEVQVTMMMLCQYTAQVTHFVLVYFPPNNFFFMPNLKPTNLNCSGESKLEEEQADDISEETHVADNSKGT